MINKLRVGIAATGGRSWLGGVSFVELLVRALAVLPRSDRPEVYFILNEKSLLDYDLFLPAVKHADRLLFLGIRSKEKENILGVQCIWCQTADELFSHIDLYLPINSEVSLSRPAISWIPDFQHLFLPEFFSQEELAVRNNAFKNIAENARMIIFSSQAVQDDFWQAYPNSHAATGVVNYRLLFDEDVYRQNPIAIQEKYQLPEEFVLCCNQFWIHKNHKILFEAIALMRKRGKTVHLACTGKTYDYRWPNYFEELLKYIKDLGIEDLVHILGLIPREDQLQLLRRCVCVVQPSLFEGLSLIVCEARALGKPIVVSDIPVHREQEYGVSFDPANAEDLANVLSDQLESAQPGPDNERECLALRDAHTAVINFAKEVCRILEKAAGAYGLAKLKYQQQTDRFITIATTLAPGNVTVQRRAVDSWLRMGFHVSSLNTAEEIAALGRYFPDVAFVPLQRDARQQYGKPYVFFDDMMAYLHGSGSDICGIVNSDIILHHPNLFSVIQREAIDAMLFGCRIDLPALDSDIGNINIGGYDFFFFDKKVASCYPKEGFCIGLPWWDYWAVLWPLAKGVRTKKIATPVAFHLRHETNWGGNTWFPLGQIFSRHVSVPFPVNNQTMIELQRYIHNILENGSETIMVT